MKPKLSENISKKIYSVRPGTSMQEAYQFMKEKRIRHLVVIEEDKSVMGVISDRDFNRALQTHIKKADSIKVVSEHFEPSHKVQDFMSWDIQNVSEDASVKDVALKLLEKKLSSLLVVDKHNTVKGIITTDDLLWILVKLLEGGESHIIEDLKAQIANSPLGFLANSLSQTGI